LINGSVSTTNITPCDRIYKTMDQEGFQQSTTTMPVADVRVDGTSQGIMMTRTYPVKLPEEERNDFGVEVRASILRKCRFRLSQFKDAKFPWTEVLLSIATTCIGAILSALVAGIQIVSPQGIVSYVILPCVAIGTFITSILIRKLSQHNVADIAKEVLSDLPDPDKTS
jgi:hypothetical protein